VKTLAGELGGDIQGIYLLEEDDETLKPEVLKIFGLIAKWNAVLATGHVTLKEAKIAVKAATDAGVKKIIVTHPLASFVNYSLEDMREIIDMGATYLEHVYNDTTRQVGHPIERESIFKAIKSIGAKHCIMSTDAGQWLNPVPSQQMGIYIKDMLDYGISPEDVRIMVKTNPAKVIGI
jgi:predicted TIM-barrel fold metal-dependent hydrolase